MQDFHNTHNEHTTLTSYHFLKQMRNNTNKDCLEQPTDNIVQLKGIKEV